MFTENKLSITGRIFLLFSIAFMSIIFIWIISFRFIENSFRENVGDNNSTLSRRIIEEIDIIIEEQIKDLELLSYLPDISKLLERSNAEFEALGTEQEIEAFIQVQDNDWQNNLELQNTILSEELSQFLMNTYQRRFFLRFGYHAFSEIFLTNRFGALVASTNRTSDYNQADEQWWQLAKESNFFLQDAKIDSSSQTFGLDMALAIKNDSQEVIGIMKGVIDISQLIGRARINFRQEIDTTITILNKHNQVIYSTKGYRILEESNLPNIFFEEPKEEVFFDDENNLVYSHAHSLGFGSYGGFDWVLVVSKSLSNALSRFIDVTSAVILWFVAVVLLGSFLLFLVTRSINKPIKNFISIAESINTFDSEIDFGSASVPELQKLSSVFNKMTARLRSSFEDLEEKNIKVAKLAIDLKTSNDDLEQFAYIASHDLQEPLRKIRAFGDLLVEEEKDNISPDGKRYIEIMQSSAARMGDLIISLLNYSRVNTRMKELSSVSLKQVLETVIQDLELVIRESGTEIEHECGDIQVNGVFNQLAQVFQNLISNSIKFQAPDKKPKIIISCIPNSQADRKVISVKDNGIGIDEEHFKEIFRPFRKLHARTEYKGSGIGLSICKKIMTRIGGDIAVKSKKSEGAEFLLTFPLAKGVPSET
jgi:signal transduction histidine kinase